MSTTAADYCEEFFNAAQLPTRTHEEWLLRICSQLMQREAAVVRMLEEQSRYTQCAEQETPRPGAQRGRKWKRSSRRLDTSTGASMETDEPSSNA